MAPSNDPLTRHARALVQAAKNANDRIASLLSGNSYALEALNAAGRAEQLAYRVISEEIKSYGGLVRQVGLFSRGEGDDDFKWDPDRFEAHMKQQKSEPASPYISITTSTLSAKNFMYNGANRPDFVALDKKEVVVIDMQLLRYMDVEHECTTKIDYRMGFFRTDFITDSHFLVYEHIPWSCIKGFVPAKRFKEVWAKTGGRPLSWADLASAAHPNQMSRFLTNPQFVADITPTTAIDAPASSTTVESEHTRANTRQRQMSPPSTAPVTRFANVISLDSPPPSSAEQEQEQSDPETPTRKRPRAGPALRPPWTSLFQSADSFSSSSSTPSMQGFDH